MKGQHPGNQGDNPNNPEKVSIVGKVPIEYDPKAVNNIANAIRDQTTTQENAGNTSDGISNRAVDQQQRANNIGKWALWVSGFALATTIVVIVLNYKAIDAANRSAAIADSTLKEQREEFNFLNEPHIEFSNVNVFFEKDGMLHCVYFIKNDREGVLEAIARTDTLIMIQEKDTASFRANPFAGIDINDLRVHNSEYYTNETKKVEFGVKANVRAVLTDFIGGKQLLFFVAIHSYKNSITGMVRVYRCVLQMGTMEQKALNTPNDLMTYYKTFAYNFLVNQNFDTDQKAP